MKPKTKVNKEPRISANKLGEYLVSRAGRQRIILRNQKFPPDFMTTYYKEAQEAISLFLADNMEDITILERQIRILEQSPYSNVQAVQRLTGNIEAIEMFMNVIDDIDFNGASPSLGEHAPPKMKIHNVEISVRPEIILTGKGSKGKNLVGGIKLHFPKTNPLNDEACDYVSTIMQMYCENHLYDRGTQYAKYCMVIDVPTGKVRTGVTATANRKKDIQAACQSIYDLWPSIK